MLWLSARPAFLADDMNDSRKPLLNHTTIDDAEIRADIHAPMRETGGLLRETLGEADQ